MGIWGDKFQCAVMITVDFDAESLWLTRDPENANRPGTLSHGHFGANVGVPRLLELFEEENLKSTFFIPGWVAEKYNNLVRDIDSAGHEIGHHGYLHEWSGHMKPEEEEEIMIKGIKALEGITGKKPLGYRSPAWEISPNAITLLEKHGFIYSSNLMADLVPYWLEMENYKSKIVELPVQWILDDAPFFLFSVRAPSRPIIPNSQVLSVWKEEFEGIYKWGGLYNLAVHPQFIGRPSRINMLKELIHFMRKYPRVLFGTGEEIATYWKNRQDNP